MKEKKSREINSEITYEITMNITKTFQPRLGVIKVENGRVLTEAGKIVDRWKRYCEGMFTSNAPITAVQKTRLEDTEQKEETWLPPLKSEVEWAIT